MHGISKAVGSELDLKGSYKVAKNLTYFVEAGLFAPGDFYHDAFLDGTGLKRRQLPRLSMA